LKVASSQIINFLLQQTFNFRGNAITFSVFLKES